MLPPACIVTRAWRLLVTRLLLAGLLYFCLLDLRAAGLSTAEYFLGTDPGAGNATALVALDGAFDSGTELIQSAINVNELFPGVNRIGLRFRDAQGFWGNAVFLEVQVEIASGLTPDPALPAGGGGLALVRTVAGAEYSVDGGTGVSVASQDGSYDEVVEETVGSALAANSLSVGTHRLALRFQDNEGRWGTNSFLDVVVKDMGDLVADPALPPGGGNLTTVGTLAAAEVFLDEDPGVGSGIICMAADGGFDRLAEILQPGSLGIASLAGGSHRIGLRFQGSDGEWGSPTFQGFSVYNAAAEAPTIAVQPPSRQIQMPGGLAALTVLANGTEPLSYQWFKEGLPLAAATNSWLYLNGVVAADAGGYQVQVVNDFGSITSQVAMLIVRGATYAPEIVLQPVSKTVLVGANVELNPVVDVSWPAYYQWYKDGIKLAGATATNLVFAPAQLTNSGVYWLVITNDFGAATTAPAAVSVDALMAFVGAEPLIGTNTFEGDVIVRLETLYNNGTIFYTLNGAEPDFGAIAYSGPFRVSQSSLLRAVAYDETFTEWDEMSPVGLSIVPLLTFSASTQGGGAITLDPPGGAYRRGTVVTATAHPDPGWSFMGWMGDSLVTVPSVVFTMTNNRSLNAVFGTGLTTAVSGTGAVYVDPQAAQYPYGTTVRLSAVPAIGKYFVAWGGAGSGTNSPLGFVVKNPNPTVTCLFGTLAANQFALTVVPDGLGRVNNSPRGNRFPAGQQITLNAAPDSGQAFIGWAGHLSGTNNPFVLTISSNTIVEALFTSRPVLKPDPENGNTLRDGFRLMLSSEQGLPVDLFWSGDLMSWTPMLRVTNNFGTLRLLDASAAGVPLRFYRAVAQ